MCVDVLIILLGSLVHRRFRSLIIIYVNIVYSLLLYYCDDFLRLRSEGNYIIKILIICP